MNWTKCENTLTHWRVRMCVYACAVLVYPVPGFVFPRCLTVPHITTLLVRRIRLLTPPRSHHQGEFVACLLTLLRQMTDSHYQKLLESLTSKDDLRVRSPFDVTLIRASSKDFITSDGRAPVPQQGRMQPLVIAI